VNNRKDDSSKAELGNAIARLTDLFILLNDPHRKKGNSDMKTHVIVLFILSLILALAASAQAAEKTVRQRILFDASWRFHRGDIQGITIKPQGEPVTKWRWLPIDPTLKINYKMAPPSDTNGTGWKDAAVGQDVFQGKTGFAWFCAILPKITDGIPTIHFDSVDDNGTIYLNGKYLMTHAGWSEAFDVKPGSAWKENGDNVLTVLVENTAGPGGIYGGVYLQKAGEAYAAVGPSKPDYNDHSWSVVHLPHDYVVEGKFSPTADRNHGYLPVEPAWYRKSFTLPSSDKGKSLWLDFDGIYRDSMIWLNGHFLGHHPSGYTSFRYDISDYANYGGKNVLAVHVDPTHFEGWWYEGGGIYRHVWLNVTDRLHLTPWGTFITSELPEPKPGIPAASAAVKVQTAITNDLESETNATLISRIVDDNGKEIASDSTSVMVHKNDTGEVTQSMKVSYPHLWSIQAPYLYKLVTILQQNGRTVDTTETNFGIRTIRFDKDTGFYLNGEPVKIQGTCNHQDFAGLGVAVPDNMEYWRVEQLKQMGANAWRMSHNPPTPSLLDACDKLGMLVMDENRHVGDSESNLADVASMVRRDRNHPSIIMWSMCNEEGYYQGIAPGAVIFKHMMETVHKYDTTRPISSAMNGGWFGPGFSTVENLLGVNYSYQIYDQFHQEHPDIPMFGSETASTITTRGEYVNDPVHTWVSSYNMTDGSWIPAAERPFIAGTFVWTGFDYKGEPTPYDWPDINSNFGIMDMCGFPKDNYYYYQSWWKTKPIIHLMPHWNWPGKEGQNIHVIAFSNCAKVELFLNGKSLGVKEMPRYGHLDWDVSYEPGVLSAKGYNSSGDITAIDNVETTGQPASLKLTTMSHGLNANGEDVAVVDVAVMDSAGRIVPTADNLVNFKVTGAGYIAGVGNGNPSDHDPDKANYRHAFNGLCVVDVGMANKAGVIRLIAASPGLKSAELELRSEPSTIVDK
jgi:beta-galactosidase